MTRILCPTRGGEDSYPNQDFSIALAKEKSADLLFIYIADVEFLHQIASPVVVDFFQEIEEMGEFLLVMAQERAIKSEVEAKTIVKSGIFREAMMQAITEHEVDIVVLGSAAEESGLTSQSFLEELCGFLSAEMAVEVILVHHDEVLSSYSG